MSLQLKQQLKIDWRNPLTRLLLWNAVPSLKLTDLVNGGVGKLVTSGTWNATSPLGKSLKSTSTTNGGAYWPWSKKIEKITNKVTIIAFAKPDGITSFSHFFCIPAHSTWTSPYSSLSFGQFDTSGKLNYQITASGVLHNTTSSGVYITAGDPMRCYGVSVDGANARFFVDGIFKESVALTNSGTIDFQDKVEIMLMNRVHGDLGEGLQGLLPWAAVWGRNLSDREMFLMANNPFRIYEKNQTVIPAVISSIIGKSISDTGAGSEALSIGVALPVSDNGAGSDALSLLASFALSDTGVGADALSVLAVIALSDSAAGSEALSVLATVALSDSGLATEALNIIIDVALSESGNSQEALSVLAAIALADSGAGNDTISTVAAISVPDTGAGSETVDIQAALPLTDNGAGTDTLQQLVTFALADQGVGDDTLAIQVTQSLTDAGIGVEDIVMAVALTLAESGQGIDSINVFVLSTYHYIYILAKVQQTIAINVHIKDASTISQEGDVTITYKSAAMS